MPQHIAAHTLALMVLLACQMLWTHFHHPHWPASILHSISLTVLVFALLISQTTTKAWQPLMQRIEHCSQLALAGFGMGFLVLLLGRLDYSRPVLLSGVIVTLLWFYLYHLWCSQYQHITLYVLGALPKRTQTRGLLFKPYQSDLSADELASGVVVDVNTHIDSHTQRLLADYVLAGIPIIHRGRLEEHLTRSVELSQLSDNALGMLAPSHFYARLKRFIDICVVVVTLPVSLTLGLMIAAAIAIVDKGPVFYSQTRIGYRHRPFTMYKFTSMAPSDDPSPGFATSHTPRISRLGSWLRRTHLDELPQLWNILKGDMSLVGPRPEQPTFAQSFSEQLPFYPYRHSVKPGLTGWAQVNLGYADTLESTEKKLAFDLYYLKHFSWALDCEILLRTLWVVVTQKDSL